MQVLDDVVDALGICLPLRGVWVAWDGVAGRLQAQDLGSNRCMPRDPEISSANPIPSLNEQVDQRLTELEIKAAFTEDLVEELNRTIVRQQQQIDLLVRELLQLRDQADSAQPGFRSLRDELPPHY